LKLTGALWVDDIIPLSNTNTIQIVGQKIILGTAPITTTIEVITNTKIDITTPIINLICDAKIPSGKKLICNQIVQNTLTDNLIIGNGVLAGQENLKISSNMSIDANYTLTNNGITNLYGATVNIGDNPYDILNVKSGTINLGQMDFTGTCEIATNTGITLRSQNLDIIVDNIDIEGDVVIDGLKQIKTNKIVAGNIGELDILQLNSGVASGFEMLKISSDMVLDPNYTFTVH
jgi:hypothetical protein